MESEEENEVMAVSEPELYDFAFRCVVQAVVQSIAQSAAPRAGILSGGQSGGREMDSPQRASNDRQTEHLHLSAESHATGRDEMTGSPQYRLHTSTAGENRHTDDTRNASLHSMTLPTVFHSDVYEPGQMGSAPARVEFENQIYDVPPRGLYVSKFLRQIYQGDEGIFSTEHHTYPVSRSNQGQSDTDMRMSRLRNPQRDPGFEEDFDERRHVSQQMDGLSSEWHDLSRDQYGDLEGNENGHQYSFRMREGPREIASRENRLKNRRNRSNQITDHSTVENTEETGQVRQTYSRQERDRLDDNRRRPDELNRRKRNRRVSVRRSPALQSGQDRGQETNNSQSRSVHCRSERDSHIRLGDRQFSHGHNRHNNGSASALGSLYITDSGQSEEHQRSVPNVTEGGRNDREGHRQVDSNPGPLATLFLQLLHQFYQEVMMWIYVTTVWHPDQGNLRHMLRIIANIIQEPYVSVTTSMVQGFIMGTSISHAGHFRLLIQILNPLTAHHSLSPTLASLFRVQSLMFSINLAPRQLLHRFSDIVRNAMIVMIQQHSARIIDQPGCPGTRRRTRDRNSGPQNEIGPEPRAFQPPHLMNPRQIHPASLHPHLHGAPQQVMFDMEQVPVSTPVSMTPYAIPVCTGPHLPVCTGAHHPVCSTAPTWSIPGCGVPLPSCNMQHIPTCSLPQIPFHPGSIPPLFHHHPAANHIPPQHLAPPTHFNPSARGHSEEEVTGLLDQRSRFPLHPGTLHPHGATPFTASAPVMLQEPHVHPTPHDIYGPFQRHFARQRTSGRNGRLRSLPLPPPPYPGFLLHFLAMLGNPPMPYGRDFHEDATEVENYEALLNLAERLGEAKPKGLTKHEIEQLPAYRFNKENHHSDMDQTSCVVCMCDFENRQLLRVLPCSHEFHAKCVDKWLKTNRTCPICRADATEIASQSD
ncbi:uncharacterized protein LOC134273846 isoform X2 [Saccostrea cucullata]|uniref:uncharacterized protein LOC134273846 isoform X2 n=1 Tax=Saccostrea cuccullata TaxID=36930 RepID=UPI002ED5EA50